MNSQYLICASPFVECFFIWVSTSESRIDWKLHTLRGKIFWGRYAPMWYDDKISSFICVGWPDPHTRCNSSADVRRLLSLDKMEKCPFGESGSSIQKIPNIMEWKQDMQSTFAVNALPRGQNQTLSADCKATHGQSMHAWIVCFVRALSMA